MGLGRQQQQQQQQQQLGLMQARRVEVGARMNSKRSRTHQMVQVRGCGV
jgi:hypothetical protein